MIDFNYFCTQKWLEYKDNLTLDHMSEEEYRNKHHDWLLEQYNKQYNNDFKQQQGRLTDLNWDGQVEGTYRYQR